MNVRKSGKDEIGDWQYIYPIYIYIRMGRHRPKMFVFPAIRQTYRNEPNMSALEMNDMKHKTYTHTQFRWQTL